MDYLLYNAHFILSSSTQTINSSIEVLIKPDKAMKLKGEGYIEHCQRMETLVIDTVDNFYKDGDQLKATKDGEPLFHYDGVVSVERVYPIVA